MTRMIAAVLRGLFWRVASAVWLCVPILVAADTVTLIPAEDATIAEQDPSSALGDDTMLKSGTTGPNEGAQRNRALLKFDFTKSIPGNALVTSAALTLTVVQTPPTTTNVWFHLHKVVPPWSESSVTWTNRLSSSPAAPWSAPGGAAPLDFASSATQSSLITGMAAFSFASNPVMVADVQDWVKQPLKNAGWILLCDLEDLERSVRKFGSSEAGNPVSRPALTVQFTLPAPPPTLTPLPPANDQFQFEFNAESNTSYTVEYSSDLEATHWPVLATFAPLAAPANLRVSEALVAGGTRFYRVRSP